MPSLETTVTQKGQVTIPREVRELLRLKPRDRVRFEIIGEKVTILPATSSLLEGFGAVTPHRRPEDWQAIRATVEEAIAEDAAAEGIG